MHTTTRECSLFVDILAFFQSEFEMSQRVCVSLDVSETNTFIHPILLEEDRLVCHSIQFLGLILNTVFILHSN
jgi:hypothetical protein